MRAIVLVGGQGTRLRPLTNSLPKPMLPVLGRPMIARTIEWLGSHGVEEVVFSLGYLPDAFMEAFPHASHAGVKLAYAVESEPLDTAGAIRFAAGEVAALNERVVVVNGDVLTDLDLGALVGAHEESGAEGTIHLTPVEDPSAYGVVPTDTSGRVLAFIEKPAPGSAPTNLINGGTYVLEPAALARVDELRRVSIEREIFPAMVADGVLYGWRDDAYWIDTGTPHSYLTAQFDSLTGVRALVELEEHVEVEPGIRLCSDATIEGEMIAPVLVGRGATIARGARVERAVLGDRVVIGAGAIVRDSVILDDAEIEAGALIEGSIVGARARVGSDAVLRAATIVGFDTIVAAGTTLDSARHPV